MSTLFDITPDLMERTPLPIPPAVIAAESRARAAAKPKAAYDMEAASRYAFCYTSTELGNSSGIRFAMSVEDAQAWCESDISRGTLHGTRWSYFWTRIKTFIEYKGEYEGYRPRIVLDRLTDNGQWDERIASLGLVKIGLPEFPAFLEPMGVDVVTLDTRAVAS